MTATARRSAWSDDRPAKKGIDACRNSSSAPPNRQELIGDTRQIFGRVCSLECLLVARCGPTDLLNFWIASASDADGIKSNVQGPELTSPSLPNLTHWPFIPCSRGPRAKGKKQLILLLIAWRIRGEVRQSATSQQVRTCMTAVCKTVG